VRSICGLALKQRPKRVQQTGATRHHEDWRAFQAIFFIASGADPCCTKCPFAIKFGYPRRLTPEEPAMKKLNVTIQLEMSVPDDWELVGTSEGTPVLKLPNGVFMDVAIEPLFASDPEETWSSTDDDDVLNDILDMVESEAVTYEFITH
jgi:hypothetical protein